MIDGLDEGAGVTGKTFVIVPLRAGKDLAVDHAPQRLRRQHAPGLPDPGNRQPQILVGQIARIDQRLRCGSALASRTVPREPGRSTQELMVIP